MNATMPDLKKRIEGCSKCKNADPWLFPKEEGVEGFLGCRKIMFVGDRPSTGKSGDDALDNATKSFYELLEDKGFADAHLTDLTKCRGKVEDTVGIKEISNCLEYFKEELNTIKPTAIVALGYKPYTILQFLLPALGKTDIQLERIRHYSYIKRFGKKDYAEEFDQLQRELNKKWK